MSIVRPDNVLADVIKSPKRNVDQLSEADKRTIRVLRDRLYLDLSLAGFSYQKIAAFSQRIAGLMNITTRQHIHARIKSLVRASETMDADEDIAY